MATDPSESVDLAAVAARLGIPYVAELGEGEGLDPHVVERLPRAYLRRFCVVPVAPVAGGYQVALADPANLAIVDEVGELLGCPVEVVLTSEHEVHRLINRLHDTGEDAAESAVDTLESGDYATLEEELEEIEDLLDVDESAPIIRLINMILYQAVDAGASDVHIEPYEREVVVRYRIDGVLYARLRPPRRFHAPITSRIKVMANLNIAEKRLPQDGRIKIKVADKEVDIRVSVIPTAFGERVVMRLLDKETVLYGLDEIGFDARHREIIDHLIHLSHGILLVTGPTGSGKSTSLYAILQEINQPDKNIITIEDPVEYQIAGVGQIHVNTKVGLTFAAGLRSILRQDPDVVMVGEIRDRETAEIASQASLTGHLVFSTLHTNDAASAITRLIDMGIEPFLVASSVEAIIAQRLVRRVCPHCAEPFVAPANSLARLGIDALQAAAGHLRHGLGCSKCFGSGYAGRIAIYEILRVDETIRHLVMENVEASRIKAAAIGAGMHTLLQDGAAKVLAGITTIEEVLRVANE
ncbi:MAG: type II secretion system protein GspE [Nitrospirae bacterium CG_4_9_14_0_8_um_filter_70_14]|nr:MAG: type II secretion system protein GspE [Nitrospirae bacterium CG_4_9_14_0_8_um_filter_70_14]